MRDTMNLAVRLMVCALAAALLLAVVNAFTEDKIAANNREKMNAARREVIGDFTFEDAQADLSACKYITGVYRAMDGKTCVGHVYELESRGYGGTVYMCVGIDTNGAITEVKVSAHSETKGLGTGAETTFMAQFAGFSANDGEDADIDSMSGATVSSNAVKNAVDEALAHYEMHFGGGEAQ